MGQQKKRAKKLAKKFGLDMSGGTKKGAAGTGARRKQERRVQQRSAKDRHEQLAEFHVKQKRRLDHLARQAGEKEKKGGTSTGFEKALAGQAHAVVARAFERYFWRGAQPTPGEPDDALKARRRDLGIKLRGAPTPPPVSTFTDPALPEAFGEFFNARKVKKIQKPTPIQAQVWPAALCGLDVIGIAPTGSGKTLAYLLPALPHVLAQQRAAAATGAARWGGPVCLSLVPTRELAQQVADTLTGGGGAGGWLKRLFGLRAGAVYGGAGKEEQVDAVVTLGAPHMLAATPGRLLDLMGLGVLSMENVTYLVLDEADRMLALGFEPQLTAITKAIRPNRQALLFSATFPGKLREAAEQWLGAERVTIRVAALETAGAEKGEAKAESDGDAAASDKEADKEDDDEDDVEEGADSTAATTGAAAATGSGEPRGRLAAAAAAASTLTVSSTIHQTVHVCAVHKKPRKLLKFIDKVRSGERAAGVRQRAAIMVFCGQIKTLRTVATLLEKHGERCAPLHSGIPQAKREMALQALKVGKIDTVVATDLASRGLHISRLRHVINYDFPSNLESYCHRIGRVGRQGAEGYSYSFFHRGLLPLAPGLVDLLQRCKQRVDPNLKALAEGRDTGAEEADGGDDDDDEDEAEAEEEAEGAKAPAAAAAKVASGEAEKPDAEEEESDDDDDDGGGASDDAAESDGDLPQIGGRGLGGGICIRPRGQKRARSSSSEEEEEDAPAPASARGGAGDGAPRATAGSAAVSPVDAKKKRRQQQQQKSREKLKRPRGKRGDKRNR
eukprot:TRINITY_DN22944_c0_g1_i1.p1 TRINITY_DN22944_c0_g1~~TRINITY_DN22944_c0_g1_i1.p1  ORF type:complete len:785 (-),score=238.24 TRINITY_DN22944_c0_g1_i1:8-2362(-)